MSSTRRIYVASSWRNAVQPGVVTVLRQHGHEVYDFRNPPNGTGFHWSEVIPGWNGETCDATDYLHSLDHPRSVSGFLSDYVAMERSDTCVLVLPCGRSAHLELGWFVGHGKRTAVLLDGPHVTPELMYKLVDHIAPTMQSLLEWLNG